MSSEEKLVWIKKVEKKGKKFLVYTDVDDDPIKCTEDIIVSNRIIKGNSFYPETWEKIKASTNEGLIFDKVLSFIDYKMRTEKEIEEYLMDKACSSEEITSIIERLKNIKMIDDTRYTKIYVENEINHLSGPILIRYDLKNKGIKEELINKKLSEYPDDVFFDNAVKVAKGCLKSFHGEPINKQKEIIYSKLARMGYSSMVAGRVTSIIQYNEVDLDKLQDLYLKIKENEEHKNKIIQKLLAKGYDYSDIKKIMKEE